MNLAQLIDRQIELEKQRSYWQYMMTCAYKIDDTPSKLKKIVDHPAPHFVLQRKETDKEQTARLSHAAIRNVKIDELETQYVEWLIELDRVTSEITLLQNHQK